MFVERLSPIAATRLVTIVGDAPAIEAAHLLLDRRTYLIAVLGVDGVLAGVVTKTDIVRQMNQLRNPVQGGHRLRWKADTRMVIADTW